MLARRTPLALIVAALAVGCGGDSQCGGGASSTLSIWGEKQHRIGATYKLAGARPGTRWRLVFVHEGHVSHSKALADGSGAFKLTRRIDDYHGVDHVSVRAYGPDGATCAAAADLSDDQT